MRVVIGNYWILRQSRKTVRDISLYDVRLSDTTFCSAVNYMMGLSITSLYIYVKYVIVSLKYFRTVKEQLRNTVFPMILCWTSNVLSFSSQHFTTESYFYSKKSNKISTKYYKICYNLMARNIFIHKS